ncbi:MAG: Isonitrile hydratase [Candidatus Erwinia impunctatus]|nr:Isonitrile hydratase [Culicoides impunctatus]
MSINVAIFLFDNVEVLDFAGPYEVFTCATRVAQKRDALFNVFTVGETGKPVRARAGLNLTPDFTLNNHPDIDCLIVPGGVVNEELVKPHIIHWLSTQSTRSRITASVCTGAFLLAKTGNFDGKRFTTHWEDIADLRRLFPAITVESEVRWVDEGALVSSAGISAGIDMSLHLIEKLTDRQLAEKTARQLEFDWTENRPKN